MCARMCLADFLEPVDQTAVEHTADDRDKTWPTLTSDK